MNSKKIKFAVIQTAFPGDVILSTPIFEALKDKYPGCGITAVVRPESEILIRFNPNIENIIVYDKYGKDKGLTGIFRIARKLRENDEAVIIQRHLRSVFISFFAGIKRRTGFDIASGKFLYTDKIRYMKNRHEVERVLDLIAVDNNDKRYRPKIFIDEAAKSHADDVIKKNKIDSSFAVLCPGSVWATKRYPFFDRLARLIKEKFDIPILLIGGKDDFDLFEEICNKVDIPIINLAGQTNILQSAAVIKRAKFVISNDSAPAHIAAAVGTPVIAIFGPTTEKFGFAPYSEQSIIVDIGKLYCRPCSSHGSKKCPEGHFKCMNELRPELIIESAKSLAF